MIKPEAFRSNDKSPRFEGVVGDFSRDVMKYFRENKQGLHASLYMSEIKRLIQMQEASFRQADIIISALGEYNEYFSADIEAKIRIINRIKAQVSPATRAIFDKDYVSYLETPSGEVKEDMKTDSQRAWAKMVAKLTKESQELENKGVKGARRKSVLSIQIPDIKRSVYFPLPQVINPVVVAGIAKVMGILESEEDLEAFTRRNDMALIPDLLEPGLFLRTNRRSLRVKSSEEVYVARTKYPEITAGIVVEREKERQRIVEAKLFIAIPTAAILKAA